MHERGIQRIPAGGLWGAEQLVHDVLPSTNRWVLAQAGRLAHGTVVRALRQTDGHGRFERAWVAPGRCCLTLSVYVRPGDANGWDAAVLLPAAALAVHTALHEFGVSSRLKWPNDVMTDRGKIAGILAETDDARSGIVLGIGLNVNVTEPALDALTFAPPPTSMAVERQRLFDIDLVCRRLLVCLEKTLDLAGLQGMAFVREHWAVADDLAGKEIVVCEESGQTTGTYDGLHENGQLRLVDADGETHLFWSGDVSVQRP